MGRWELLTDSAAEAAVRTYHSAKEEVPQYNNNSIIVCLKYNSSRRFLNTGLHRHWQQEPWLINNVNSLVDPFGIDASLKHHHGDADDKAACLLSTF